LPRLSFEHTKSSAFKIKTQPNAYCLSTIESTLCILELLNKHNIENTKNEQLESFLKPFDKMIQYQINRAVKENGGKVRYKKPYKNEIFNLVL
ncbi:MAG: DTW domain-containing protein, partial [Campylobacterota bacterium]|nr:DTW domain-containing protein [Campylobacterota bacterium]